METDTVFSRKSRTKAGKELVGRTTIDDPDLVMFFPTTAEVKENGVQETIAVLNKAFDCPVGGVSLGGFATEQTDGFELFGSCLMAVQGLSFTTEYVSNVWTSEVDDLTALLTRHDGPVLTFESGSRAGGDSQGWKLLQRLSRRIVTRDSLGQRKRLINKVQNTLPRYKLGWSPLFLARMRAMKQDAQIVNFSSGDSGDMVDGYEFWNDNLTDSQGAAFLYSDTPITSRVAQTSEDTLSRCKVLETFDDLGVYHDVIYRFGEQTFRDLCDTYPLGLTVGRGGFTHYFLIETFDGVYATPASSDLGVVISPVPIDADARAHLVRAPSFDQYQKRYSQLLEKTSEQPHISLNPTQMDCYRNSLNKVIDMTAEKYDTYLLTVDNAFRQSNVDYNYPSVIEYK